MMINFFVFLGMMLPPGADTEGAGAAGNVADGLAGAAQAAPPPATGGMSPIMMLLIWGGVILAMYLLMFRPQRKREKKMKEMQATITTGDNIITNAGLFGRIADVGEDCFIVEFGTNRGIRIPVLKSEVVGIRDPKMTPPPKPSE